MYSIFGGGKNYFYDINSNLVCLENLDCAITSVFRIDIFREENKFCIYFLNICIYFNIDKYLIYKFLAMEYHLN